MWGHIILDSSRYPHPRSCAFRNLKCAMQLKPFMEELGNSEISNCGKSTSKSSNIYTNYRYHSGELSSAFKCIFKEQYNTIQTFVDAPCVASKSEAR